MSKALRECQIADSVLPDGGPALAATHYERALGYFTIARNQLALAEDETERNVGNLLQAGNDQLRKALNEYAEGYAHSARNYYRNALDSYDRALELIG
jgi:tetratricopeptide (TPR) repeat protein